MIVVPFMDYYDEYLEKETKKTSGDATVPLFKKLSFLESHDEIVSTRSHIAIGKRLISYGGNICWRTVPGLGKVEYFGFFFFFRRERT